MKRSKKKWKLSSTILGTAQDTEVPELRNGSITLDNGVVETLYFLIVNLYLKMFNKQLMGIKITQGMADCLFFSLPFGHLIFHLLYGSCLVLFF